MHYLGSNTFREDYKYRLIGIQNNGDRDQEHPNIACVADISHQ